VKLLRESLPLCGKPYVEMIAVMAHYNPFAEHAGLQKIGESTIHPSISEAITKLEGRGFTSYLLAVPEYNLEKLEGQVDQVKDVLSSFKYPYNRRIAGAHGNYKMSDYRSWLRTVEKEELARALCRLAQLNQPKIYLFWAKDGLNC
jgi:hypothetical protein